MPRRRLLFAVLATLLLGACASVPQRDPLQVTIAGVQSIPGEGMELRLLLKLRVQNPNDDPIEFTGSYVELEVQNRTFATGVSSEPGVVPAFGEAVIAVPVTVSVLRMVRQVMGVLDGKPVERITYEMKGRLSGGVFSTVRFSSRGEFELPASEPVTANIH
jgi:LEA14-like dessication related protein